MFISSPVAHTKKYWNFVDGVVDGVDGEAWMAARARVATYVGRWRRGET
jgi:hypothetical protein